MSPRHVLYGFGLLCLNALAAACEQPSLVSIPATALIGNNSAQIIVRTKQYVAGTKAYVGCVQAELAAAGGTAAPESLRRALTRRNNAAVAEAETVVTLFTERLAPIAELYLADFITGTGEQCISTSRLKTTAVVDDLAVLFIERSGRAYLNVLEAVCPNLARYSRFEARRDMIGASRRDLLGGFAEGGAIQTNRLCSDEFIYPYSFDTVVALGQQCALGQFFELTEEQTQRLGEARAVARRPDEPEDGAVASPEPPAGP